MSNDQQPQPSVRLFESASEPTLNGTNIRTTLEANAVHHHYYTPQNVPEVNSPSESSRIGAASSSPQDAQNEDPPPMHKDIYIRHMRLQRLGSPLWLTEPNQKLPVLYRREGFSIGDVGFLNHLGGFSPLFNIYRSGDPLKPKVLPDGFAPLPLFPGEDISQVYDLKPNCHLASSSVRKVRNPTRNCMHSFHAASEGALLVIPEATTSQDLENTHLLDQYISRHAPTWYCYAKRIGRNLQNGDIRVITGWDKTTSWGMATSRGPDCQFEFKQKTLEDDDPNYISRSDSTQATSANLRQGDELYKWDYTGDVYAKVGPEAREINELRLDEEAQEKVHANQCLFIRTANAKLRSTVWAALTSEISAEQDIENGVDSTIPPSNSTSPTSTGRSRAWRNILRGTRQGRQASDTPEKELEPLSRSQGMPDDSLWENTAATSVFDHPVAATYHPSDALNELLLDKFPTATIAITHDEDWFSVLNTDDLTIPDVDELWRRIALCHKIREEEGMVYVERSVDGADHVDTSLQQTRSDLIIPNEKEVFARVLEDHRIMEDDGVSQPHLSAGIDSLNRHHNYYIDGADLHVLVQKTLFRVHGYFFSRESPVFRCIIDPATPGSYKAGQTDSDPIILQDVSPEEFEKLLWVFYNPRYSIYDTTIEHWRDILNLADRWDFPEVKELAVRELHKKKDLDVVSKIALYQQYKVDRRYLVPLYAQLCERPTPLTLEEGTILGLETTLLISTNRETLRAKPSDEGLNPLPEGMEEDDIFRVLESEFDLEEGSTKNFREENPASLQSLTTPNHINTGSNRFAAHKHVGKPAKGRRSGPK